MSDKEPMMSDLQFLVELQGLAKEKPGLLTKLIDLIPPLAPILDEIGRTGKFTGSETLDDEQKVYVAQQARLKEEREARQKAKAEADAKELAEKRKLLIEQSDWGMDKLINMDEFMLSISTLPYAAPFTTTYKRWIEVLETLKPLADSDTKLYLVDSEKMKLQIAFEDFKAFYERANEQEQAKSAGTPAEMVTNQ